MSDHHINAALVVALRGLHEICQHALAGNDGLQHANFETRGGKFVRAVEAMQQAEAALAASLPDDPKTAAQSVPEGKPTAWYFEARHIDSAWAACVSTRDPGPEGVRMRKVTPLYASPPAPAQPAEDARDADFYRYLRSNVGHHLPMVRVLIMKRGQFLLPRTAADLDGMISDAIAASKPQGAAS